MKPRLVGLIAATACLMAGWPSSSLGADVVSAPERCSPKTGCSFSASSFWMSTGESPLVAMPARLDFPHDVLSTGSAADGRALFESAQVGAGRSAVIEGAEYLDPGVYHFICSIHSAPTIYGTRMEADLVVVDNGTPPRPRPAVAVEVPRQSLAGVLSKGKLQATVRAEEAVEQVALVARIGKAVVARNSGIALSPGQSRSISLRVSRGTRQRLAKRDSAVVSLLGSARFGVPTTVRATLR